MNNRIVFLIIGVSIIGLGFWGGSVWGQVAAWDFTGVGSTSLPTYPATTFDANLINTSGSSNITRGSTAAWSTGNNSFRTVGFLNNGVSISNTDYFQITLSPAAGYKVSLSALDAKFAGTASFCVSPGVSNQFAYSLDGTNFTLIGSPQVLIGTPATLTQIDLSGIPALQDVFSGTTITLRYYASGQTTTGGWGFNSPTSGSNGLSIGGSVAQITTDPTISVSPSTLSGFTYVLGDGPSAQHSFTVSGTNLTNNIILTPPDDYEISILSGSSFAAVSSFTLNQSGGIVNSTSIYVRLKAGLAVNTYNSKDIDISSTGATSKTVACNGSVTAPTLVVISQVYGGGGNTSAPYLNDYIELFNRGSSVVNINNWSIQYANATNASWTVVNLPNTTLNPGQYFLIKLASGGSVGASLPTADLTNTGLNISATAGKVALCSSISALSGNCPTGSPIIDFVGYGAAADCREGSSSSNNAPAGSNTISLVRANGGCTDTDNNISDFTASASIPRNTSTALNPCTTPTITLSTATLSGFTYILGSGPSAEQSFTASGTNLIANISIASPTDYEISTGTGAFFVPTSPISLSPSGGIVATTTIYVRLKAGLSAGTYNSKIINITSTGASSKTVTCSGYVTCSAISILATNTAYSENFDALANSGLSSYVPCGWAFSESGGNTFYTAGNGGSGTGDTYSFGTGTDIERSFGGLLSGTLIPTIGASYQNNTGDVINTLFIQYYGEQWRLGALSREDRLDFQYSVNATSLTTGTWTNFDPLDFIAPVTSGTVGSSLDGNNASNKALISANLIGLTISNGATFWIRWTDFNATGADDGLSVDDFSITALSPCAVFISGFAPASGPTGTQVTITGSNFTNITNVQFNGINSTFIVNSSTQISATVPSGNTSGFITITNNTPCSVTSISGFFTISTDCSSAASDLLISEYIEGSSYNKAIEIVNLTGVTKNLSNYKLVMYFNGLTSIGHTINFPNYDLLNNAVYVVTNDSANTALKNIANLSTSNTTWFNGDDAVVLMTVANNNIDIFGNIGCDPGTTWTDGTTTTLNHTLVRKNAVYTGITVDPGNTDCLFPTLASEWEQYDQDDFSHLGTHGTTAGVPPALTNLIPQIVCEGSPATFTLTASSGNPPYAFEWKVLDNTGLWTTVSNVAPYTITNIGDNSTLDISNCPSNFHNYQYYCEVTNNGNSCFTASNAAKLSVANLWKGVTPNWENSTNWICGTIPSSATNVIIPSVPSHGSMPVINKLITADCKNIEIQTDATLTINSDELDKNASLIVTETYTGPGKVIYNRYLTPAPALPLSFRRWFIVSSPVNTSLGGFDGSKIVFNDTNIPADYDFAPYSEPQNEWKYQTSLPINLANGQGYLARVNGDGILKFTGPLNNSDVTVAVTGNSTNGWNAVGNPFTSAIGINENALTTDKFLEINSGVLDPSYKAIYIWYQTDGISTGTGTGSYTPGDQYYRTINNIGYSGKAYGGPISAKYVQAGQGFLINVSTNGNITFTKNNVNGTIGMQLHSDTLTLKRAETSWPGLTLLATNNCRTRSTIVAFNEKMTTGLDPSYDAGLLSVSDFNVHTHLVAGGNETSFTIQCLPDTMYSTLSVPVGIDLPQPGTLTFKVAGVILPEGIYPVIEDRMLQLNTPLKTETDSLTVDLAVATRGTGRFYLHFGGTEINTGIKIKPETRNFTAHYANQKISLFGTPEQGSKAWLYDINGRKLSGEYRLTAENQNEIPAIGLSSGIYLLKIEGKTNRQILKITILNH